MPLRTRRPRLPGSGDGRARRPATRPRAPARERQDAAPRQDASAWSATYNIVGRPALTRDVRTEICVVGAGIAGLTTAYRLTAEGRSVILLDDGPVGGGETGRSTAHLSNAMDVYYQTIARVHGATGARLAAESHTAAIAEIAAIVQRERVSCDFESVDGSLFLARGDSPDILERERTAAHAAGLTGVHWRARAPLPFDTGRCLVFPGQAQFHPLKYVSGLARAISRRGGRIFGRAHVEGLEAGRTVRVCVSGGREVTADAVVLAPNTPIVNLDGIQRKQGPFTSYAIAARVPTRSVTLGLYWDTDDPYHYVRLSRMRAGRSGGRRWLGHDLLIVGGEDHPTGQAEDADHRYEALEAWVRDRFPMVEGVDFRWSGRVMNSLDGLAFIGPNPGDGDHVYVATGDTGMGLTHGTIAGILLADLIAGRDNPWRKLYDPARSIAHTVEGGLRPSARESPKASAGPVSADKIRPQP